MTRIRRDNLPPDVREAARRMKQQKGERDAACPFCESGIRRPSPVFSISETEYMGGRCTCGAMFLMDPSGKNMGQVFMDLLSIMAGEQDGVIPAEYESQQFLYNSQMHTMKSGKHIGRSRGPKIIFVKAGKSLEDSSE